MKRLLKLCAVIIVCTALTFCQSGLKPKEQAAKTDNMESNKGNMDAIVVRLRADGVRFVDEVTEYEGLGKFVHIEDGEGRRVELWEPAK